MILEKFSLAGKVAIVTGSNTGLGRAIALGLAQAGADVAGVYSTSPPVDQDAYEALGRRFLPVQADLRTIDPVGEIVERTVSSLGRADILVNNAGIIRRMSALEFGEQDWDEVMNVNLKSLFFLSQAAAKQFVAQGGGGKIINVASVLSFQGGIRVPSYTASKSGAMGLTRLLANEWAPHGINVNAIAPGYMVTDNTKPLREDPVRNQQIRERIPAGDWGRPEDLQGAAVFLASDAAKYVHGYTLVVDGGWLAR